MKLKKAVITKAFTRWGRAYAIGEVVEDRVDKIGVLVHERKAELVKPRQVISQPPAPAAAPTPRPEPKPEPKSEPRTPEPPNPEPAAEPKPSADAALDFVPVADVAPVSVADMTSPDAKDVIDAGNAAAAKRTNKPRQGKSSSE